MRTTTRIATVLATAAAVAVVCGGWGSAVSAPAYAPTAPQLPSTSLAVGGADADVVLRGTPVLPSGIALPHGIVATQAKHTYTRGQLRGWETSVELGPVAADDALRSVREELTEQGFELRSGSHDVFGARRHDGRWEIVVARVEHRGRADGARDVLTVGVGTRPA